MSNLKAPAALYYDSVAAAPAQPDDMNDPGLTTDISTEAAGWDPVLSGSRTPQSQPDGLSSALPPTYEAGELDYYKQVHENGDAQTETEEMSWIPHTFPEAEFQAGELSHYESVYEHGDHQSETGAHGYGLSVQTPYGEEPDTSTPDDALQLSSPYTQMQTPISHYQFSNLPFGTYSNFKSGYDSGDDFWDEVYYQRYYPLSQPQIQEFYSFGL